MSTNPNDPSQLPDSSVQPPPTLAGNSQPAASSDASAEPSPSALASGAPVGDDDASRRRRTILIGSQRDPAAYRPKPRRDWVPVIKKKEPQAPPQGKKESRPPERPLPEQKPATLPAGLEPMAVVAMPEMVTVGDLPSGMSPAGPAGPAPEAVLAAPVAAEVQPVPMAKAAPAAQAAPAVEAAPTPAVAPPAAAKLAAAVSSAPAACSAPAVAPVSVASAAAVPAAAAPAAEAQPAGGESPALEEQAQPSKPLERRRRERPQRPERPKFVVEDTRSKIAPPSIRGALPPDLEEEYQAALADMAIDQWIIGAEAVTKQAVLEPETRLTGRVVAVRRDEVFVELGGREQGVLPLKNLAEPPQPGAVIEVVVVRFHPEEGLYELTLPGGAAEVGDWSDLEEGMIVEARVTGHNTGGLECEVNHIRGFIPISQISLFRVEHPEDFVGQKFPCLVTEANPERRNLVLSRRAVLEREREESRKKLLDSLEPGQVREGVVRKLMDFGAFVDLGGVDGLVHISQLSWGRVNHPSEVLAEGQTIQVKIQSVEKETGRISLTYRDMQASPWADVEKKYPQNTAVRGKVVKLMEFGAFVELEPGVEGLVHISELAPKRVWRVSDVVKEGDEVDVKVLSVDPAARRISLSMKALAASPEPVKEEEPAEQPAAPAKPRVQFKGPLKGGLGRSTGGERFGLKW
jgi:small subunit ribosomal protein S1